MGTTEGYLRTTSTVQQRGIDFRSYARAGDSDDSAALKAAVSGIISVASQHISARHARDLHSDYSKEGRW